MSDQPSTLSPQSADVAAQRRARLILAVLLILALAAGVGGYFGWQAYERREEAKLAVALEAERAGNRTINSRGFGAPPSRPRINAADAQRFTDEIGKRQERARASQFEQALGIYKATAEAEREAFVDRTVAANRSRWRQIAGSPPEMTDPVAEEFLRRLRARLQRSAATRPARSTPTAATQPG